MSKYLSDLGIKSVVSLQKHIIKETGREVICVKEASGVKIIWCYNNSLHSSHIDASVIYVIQEHQVTNVIKEIKNSIKNPKVDLVIKTEPVMVKEGLGLSFHTKDYVDANENYHDNLASSSSNTTSSGCNTTNSVGAPTIGLDLVPVVPMDGPMGLSPHLDFIYEGGK